MGSYSQHWNFYHTFIGIWTLLTKNFRLGCILVFEIWIFICYCRFWTNREYWGSLHVNSTRASRVTIFDLTNFLYNIVHHSEGLTPKFQSCSVSGSWDMDDFVARRSSVFARICKIASWKGYFECHYLHQMNWYIHKNLTL